MIVVEPVVLPARTGARQRVAYGARGCGRDRSISARRNRAGPIGLRRACRGGAGCRVRARPSESRRLRNRNATGRRGNCHRRRCGGWCCRKRSGKKSQTTIVQTRKYFSRSPPRSHIKLIRNPRRTLHVERDTTRLAPSSNSLLGYFLAHYLYGPSFSWRKTQPRDLPECLKLHPAKNGAEIVGHARALKAWQQLLQTTHATRSALVEMHRQRPHRDRRLRARIVC